MPVFLWKKILHPGQMSVNLCQIGNMKNKKPSTYLTKEDNTTIAEEAALSYYPASSIAGGPFALLGIGRQSSAIQSTMDFIGYVREGIPKKALDHLAEAIALSATEVAAIIHLSERTLRRYAPTQKLNIEQSERVLELARLYARGSEVFDNLEQFKLWMGAPVGALGDRKPKEFLDTSMGIQMLTEELGRIEHGVFA